MVDEEFSFYEQCLNNLDADLKSSDPLPWANLAHLGDSITEFSLNVSVYQNIYSNPFEAQFAMFSFLIQLYGHFNEFFSASF